MTLLPLTWKNPISLIFALTFPNPLATPSQYLTITFQPSPPTSSSSCHPSSRRRRLRLCRTSRPLRHNVFVGFVDELQRQQQHQHLPVFVFDATSTARRRRLWPSSHSDAAIHRRFGFHFRYFEFRTLTFRIVWFLLKLLLGISIFLVVIVVWVWIFNFI